MYLFIYIHAVLGPRLRSIYVINDKNFTEQIKIKGLLTRDALCQK